MMMDCFALLDDHETSEHAPRARLYTGLSDALQCVDPDQIDDFWLEVDRQLAAGRQAVMLMEYEWGAKLLRIDPARRCDDGPGSVVVLLFEQMQPLTAAEVEAWLIARERQDAQTLPPHYLLDGDQALPAGVLDLRPSVDRDTFSAAIARIHEAIRAGETYQVNYTYRLDFSVFGLPVSLYRRLRARQPVGFGALIRLPEKLRRPESSACGDSVRPFEGAEWVLSCSPELFVRHCGQQLEARPMKGTAPRARGSDGDAEIARMLSQDVKNRAENLMIVDLLRNDLGRVAEVGSVRVPALFAVETYPTVFQMTSTVTARLRTDTGFPELLRALFPCGSITGAPKHRTMQLIAQLESRPRGLYTGSIGWIDPVDPALPAPGCGDFCLSVAIRTLTLKADHRGGYSGTMGVGAGIVIDSRADEEFEECQLKARFLTGLDPGFDLFESMYASREDGIRHLDLHLARLASSASALGFGFSREQICAALARQVDRLPSGSPMRIRLTLHKSGRFDLHSAAIAPLPPGPVKLLLAPQPISDGSGLLRHKTTLRSHYDEAVRHAEQQGAFDTLFFDCDGCLTEGARSNVFVRIEGKWYTPPLSCFVLPGIGRSALLADPGWQVSERLISLEELASAERIVVTNALRGALPAMIVPAKENLNEPGR